MPRRDKWMFMVLFLHIQPVNETDGVDTFSQREMRPIGCSTAPAPRPVTRWNEMSATINRSEIVLELFDAYYERVFAFARKSAGPAVAEDVTQEVFVRLLQHPRLEELTISISYLLKIAHNLLRRRHTRSTRLREILDDEIRPRELRRTTDFEPTRSSRFDDSTLDRAMERLSSDEQDAIRMIVCEGRSYTHAAQSMGVSVTTINNWKHRGLKKLRGHYDGEETTTSAASGGLHGRGFTRYSSTESMLKRA